MIPESFIKIGNENYTIDQISENILYEDDDIIIFDFFPYLNDKPIEQILNQKIQEENHLLEQSLKTIRKLPHICSICHRILMQKIINILSIYISIAELIFLNL